MNGGSVRLAIEVKNAHGFAVALEFQVGARVVRALSLRARADFEQQHVAPGAVHDAVAVWNVSLPARALAGFQDRLAVVLDWPGTASQDLDELVFVLVPVPDRGGRAGLEPGQVHAELGEADRVAERGLVTRSEE